uniref:Uncharacterized protein n=1 Tax=Romanomermis culicivorax TaxID=13658 RepID=A0A915J616_ROMCU
MSKTTKILNCDQKEFDGRWKKFFVPLAQIFWPFEPFGTNVQMSDTKLTSLRAVFLARASAALVFSPINFFGIPDLIREPESKGGQNRSQTQKWPPALNEPNYHQPHRDQE